MDKRIQNFIESQYIETNEINIEYGNLAEYENLYEDFKHERLREVLARLHYNYVSLYKIMNQRLPTIDEVAYFWAEPSRDLIKTIEITMDLYKNLRNTQYSFEIDEYYFNLIKKCQDFLKQSRGSEIPIDMPKVEIYYTIPIFVIDSTVNVKNRLISNHYPLKLIGEGSYANVYRYKDTFYNKYFVLKRAKKELNEKELERFKIEFNEMKRLSSPYVLEVYAYNEYKKEYIMEYMDYTLKDYISKNNSNITNVERKSIGKQILRAFKYIHSKKLFHRDISLENILIKEYDNLVVVKISDFGLVKRLESSLTSLATEIKGSLNDPTL